jgi:hypothetical protein
VSSAGIDVNIDVRVGDLAALGRFGNGEFATVRLTLNRIKENGLSLDPITTPDGRCASRTYTLANTWL